MRWAWWGALPPHFSRGIPCVHLGLVLFPESAVMDSPWLLFFLPFCVMHFFAGIFSCWSTKGCQLQLQCMSMRYQLLQPCEVQVCLRGWAPSAAGGFSGLRTNTVCIGDWSGSCWAIAAAPVVILHGPESCKTWYSTSNLAVVSKFAVASSAGCY